jgi:lipopolysaccharide transport system permease protein
VTSNRAERPTPALLEAAAGSVLIDARSGASGLAALWRYRELLYFLTWRDVAVRYKQAVLGVAWAIIQPVLTMVVFSVVFGQLAKLPSDGVPYPLFSFAALLPWGLFAGALQRAGTSVVASSNLITKVYFPRLLIPMSAVLAGLIDFVISLGVLGGMMAWYGVPLTGRAFALVPLAGLAVLTAFAVGTWLAALNVEYRDVGYIIPFLIQIWMYASPVVYSANIVPTGMWRIIYGLNPMAGVIQGFRWALFGTAPPGDLIWASVIVVGVLLVSGVAYFRHVERDFADVI